MDFLTKLKTLIVNLLSMDYTTYHEQELNENGSGWSNWTYIDWRAIRTMLVAFVVELVIVLLINFLFF